ncbi:hypothetical protein [Nocardia sp. NBC_01327]|uniref:hypothetical protein n=1 Tax=Nocardia sp. NBC_01327 TaxID=2903593 RepID=UPI002E13FBFC|nr:hypothetical protein OG326_42035 [Nocardia sp. NBC_01327]
MDLVKAPVEPTTKLDREICHELDGADVPWKVLNNETIARTGSREERAVARERISEQIRWIDNRLVNHMRRTGEGPGNPRVDAAYQQRQILDRELHMLKIRRLA